MPATDMETLTVEQLIQILKKHDKNMPVCLGNYTGKGETLSLPIFEDEIVIIKENKTYPKHLRL